MSETLNSLPKTPGLPPELEGLKGCRVFIGTTEVAGFNVGLWHGLQALGVPCTFYRLVESAYDFPMAQDHPLARWIRKLTVFRQEKAKRRSHKKAIILFVNLLKMVLLIRLTLNHDVFVFSNQPFFSGPWGGDLRWLRFWRKTIVFMFHGSDSRPPYLSRVYVDPEDLSSLHGCYQRVQLTHRHVNKVDHWAAGIIDHSTRGHFHQRPFLDRTFLGQPVPVLPEAVLEGGREDLTGADLAKGQWNPIYPNEPLAAAENRWASGAIRVLHCPSRRAGKGSVEIAQGMDWLKERYPAMEYRELSGVPHHDILESLGWADLVIDQLYDDLGYSVLATQAAWYGKPTVIGGPRYGQWYKLQEEELLPPFLYCDAPGFQGLLDHIMETGTEDPQKVLQWGRSLQRFVGHFWHPSQVAYRFLLWLHGLMVGELPGHGPMPWVNPADIDDWMGWGWDPQVGQRVLASYIKRYGADGLALSYGLQQRALAVVGAPIDGSMAVS